MTEMTIVENVDVTVKEANLVAAAKAVFAPKNADSQFVLVGALTEELEEMGFDAYFTSQGDLQVTGYWGADLDDRDERVLRDFFVKLATHAEDGGTVQFSNEDNGDSRWLIEGGKLLQQQGSLTWTTTD